MVASLLANALRLCDWSYSRAQNETVSAEVDQAMTAYNDKCKQERVRSTGGGT